MAFLTLFFLGFEEKVIESTAMHGCRDGPDIYIIDPANKHASGLPRSIIHDPFSNDELELD